ncbi:MAG: SprT family zinc-dependent metalloprotease [Methanobrevibacter sp.]|uniref:M48 family metallopeptidase n=1 Tax=uncultured Methanobrevibacter sp. TaxID=253161 RepID=UPI0025EDD947|nr:SprT family zinc-dependent metalloprotease [uncultured Methanobrevibacter sp.]MEE1128427.1 SprT family zinc-dependent metalloprotease [Methanobrevibacter sp.]
MRTKEIEIEGIEITLHRKKIKNLYLRVLPPNGEVVISAPYALPYEELIRFVKYRKEWILKKQDLILKNNIKPPLKYKSGERHYLWGLEYTLQLVSKEDLKKIVVDYDENIIYLPVPPRSKKETREKLLYELYRSELKQAIPPVLEKCSKIVGKKPSEIKVRNMKNWGNCRYHDKRITLNLKLAKKDPICLEYVMIHELCHLIEFNHGKKFKKLMDTYCPNWKEIKKRLNE